MRKSRQTAEPETPLDGALPPDRKGVISEQGRKDAPFVIFALPRSRTAWLSRFLSYGDWHCGHEELRHMRTLSDVEAWLSQPCTGTIETAAAPWWRLLNPNVRVVTIRRPVAEVVESMMKIPGCVFDRDALEAAMKRHDRKLDQIEARFPNVLSVKFSDLDQEDVCAALFEYCLPYQHDSAYWQALSPINIQIDMRALIRYCEAYRAPMEKLAAVARHRISANLALRRAEPPEGMTFRTEGFDEWLKDAGNLLAEHHAQIGESPENWRNKNIPLFRALDEMGAMRITTARSNGRMFGYLMTLLTPSLVTEGMMTAVNTTFFADPSCPGLGLKLQREALSMFRKIGVGEVLWETNTVGGAERIGAIYRRLGAEEKGSVFRLRLAEAA